MAIDEFDWEIEEGHTECLLRDGKDTVSIYPDGKTVCMHGEFTLDELEDIHSKMRSLANTDILIIEG